MKNNFTAYLLWFLLGGLGIHAFYCKKQTGACLPYLLMF